MTVRRQQAFPFRGSPDDARAAIADVLAADRRYHVRSHDADRWTVRYRPSGWPLILSTELQIELLGNDHDFVTIVATTRSQALIIGDAFDMYNGYLRTLGSRLAERLSPS